eukprot:254479_1
MEGGETVIPGLKALVDLGADLGLENIVVGMSHRGRLSLMSNVMRKPLESIFHEFHGPQAVDSDTFGSGDVKYHLGCSVDRETSNGKKLHMSLLPNPSHLDANVTAVLGKAYAKQCADNHDKKKTMALHLHGDASFASQGIIYEALMMTDVPDYTTGGAMHVVVNNQIGFTTDPQVARSTPHCSDVAKAIGAPIFHVNADDVESVVRVFKLAMEYRQTFHKDVVVDLVCYRQAGHNEGDEPRFTQPHMYSKIDTKVDQLSIYQKKLLDEGVCSQAEIDAVSKRINGILSDCFEKSKTYSGSQSEWMDANWDGLVGGSAKLSLQKETGVAKDTLLEIGKAVSDIPEDFTLHRRLKKVYNERAKMCKTGENIDWGTAEAFAFGSLLKEGSNVRVSGEDVERGTFSHRHAIVHDQVNCHPPVTLTPLSRLESDAKFQVCNSPLSEYGVLGFDYGYSLENPNSLVIWEAQFGDFANGAQIIFDQFISSGEEKWLRQSGLVVNLPHGYEGAGP